MTALTKDEMTIGRAQPSLGTNPTGGGVFLRGEFMVTEDVQRLSQALERLVEQRLQVKGPLI
jgi:hypothetical protein